MNLIEITRNKMKYDYHIDIWFKKVKESIESQMKSTNCIEATFYLLVVKNFKVNTEIVPVNHLFNIPDNKQVVAQIIKQKCQENCVLALVFVSEAWMATKDSNNKKEITRLSKEGIRNEPDRQECVIISKETLSGIEIDTYKIIEENGKRSIEELKLNSKEVGGRFTNLLYSPKFYN